MAFNTDADREARIEVSLKGFEPGPRGRLLRVSRREHMWLDSQPSLPDWRKSTDWVWSTGPGVEAFEASTAFPLALPPDSLAVLQLPSAGRDLAPVDLPTPPAAEVRKPRLEIWLPPSTGYADTPVEGWVLAFNGSRQEPYPKPLPDAILRVTGPARADRDTVRLAEAAGRFRLKPTGPGAVTVRAQAGEASAEKRVTFVPSIPKPVVFWEMEEETPPRGIRSQWPLAMDGTIRPNQRVARVDFMGEAPSAVKKQEVLVFELPGADKLPSRERIRGAVADLKVSPDFRCADPGVKIQAILQSSMNWWMVVGEVKLADLKEWKTCTFVTDNPDHVKAMPAAGSLWFVVHTAQPLYGSVYIDKAGLMVR
jgi:hypothetical protein